MSNKRQINIPDKHGDNEDLLRPVIAVAHDRSNTFQAPAHHHFRAQLVYASDGVMRVSTNSATWVVPPQQAVWVPPGVTHAVINESAVAFRTLYIHPQVAVNLPESCCVVAVSTLLRELILSIVTMSMKKFTPDLQEKIVSVILELLRVLEPEPMQLPLPQDRRLRVITDKLMDDPSDRRSLREWAGLVGASQSTVERLFKRELGMGFLNWCQRLRLLSAISMLSDGASVTTISYELGYASPSAFIAMFRRNFGYPPAQYLRLRIAGQK